MSGFADAGSMLSSADGEPVFRFDPARGALYLTRDASLIAAQLRGELRLSWADLKPEDLLDDINTDAMAPGWVSLAHRPEEVAEHAYAGLLWEGKRLFEPGALRRSGFQVIVSGQRKGVGSSRETAVQAERFSGIELAVAASFAPIHARNNHNVGLLMADHGRWQRLEAGEEMPRSAFAAGEDAITQQIVAAGGLFAWHRQRCGERGSRRGVPDLRSTTGPAESHSPLCAPQTMAEKLLQRARVGEERTRPARAGDAIVVRVSAGYSHDYTSAQVHTFLQQEVGRDYRVPHAHRFAAYEDHLVHAEAVPRLAPHLDRVRALRQLQKDFIAHAQVRDGSAVDGRSPGICHQLAREDLVGPGQVVMATDSHTCMVGCLNAFAVGVGATEYAALLHAGEAPLTVPDSIRFELSGRFEPGVGAKDLMLWILLHFARKGLTLGRVMEFGGPGLSALAPDDRATLTNMAAECSARTAICEWDQRSEDWVAARRSNFNREAARKSAVAPDVGAHYAGGLHAIALDQLVPMVATPGDAKSGRPSDPTNGATVESCGEVPVGIAYGGSCTAGKETDILDYARVLAEAEGRGQRLAPGVRFFLQYGSESVAAAARSAGHDALFRRMGVRVIAPGCGACIGCGPGTSESADEVTVSAINRNYEGRSGPGRLFLASPTTVAASALAGRLKAWRPASSLRRPGCDLFEGSAF